ncbi:MAG: glycosyltransferase family 1 protein [Sphingomicrobium sp.]
MRVALFSGNYNYVREGANQALNRLVADLENRGYTFRIYSPVTDTPAFEPAGTLVGVPSIPLPRRREFQLALGINRKLRGDIRAFRPDLIHVATPDILGTRAQTLAKQLGVPAVASLHTRFETYLSHYRMDWARPLVEAHLKRFYRRSDLVLVPNHALLAEMRVLRSGHGVEIWSRGVDRHLFNPARRSAPWRATHGWGDDDIVILWFGRIVAEKGIDRFIEVVQLLRRSGRVVRALVVGDGPARNRFVNLPDTSFAGQLDGEALATAVASADIMLCPSLTEAFGNVVLEGMASGLAVVSADAPSARALIDAGQSGLLCADLGEDYASAIAGLIDNPEDRQRLGQRARAAAAAFSWEEASLSVERAYADVLNRREARP